MSKSEERVWLPQEPIDGSSSSGDSGSSSACTQLLRPPEQEGKHPENCGRASQVQVFRLKYGLGRYGKHQRAI